MARPKKIPESEEIPLAEQEMAHETVVTITPPPVYTPPSQPMPRQKQVERQGALSVPYTHRYPEVRGGICEKCGVLDPNVPSQFQYKLCEHYRGMQLRCSYCPETKDPDAVIYASTLMVADSPDGRSLIVWCNSYECAAAHLKRFQLNSQ